jgi:hypothetical protein
MHCVRHFPVLASILRAHFHLPSLPGFGRAFGFTLLHRAWECWQPQSYTSAAWDRTGCTARRYSTICSPRAHLTAVSINSIANLECPSEGELERKENRLATVVGSDGLQVYRGVDMDSLLNTSKKPNPL